MLWRSIFLPVILIVAVLWGFCTHANDLSIEGKNHAIIKGFIDYEGGFYKKVYPYFYASNTSFKVPKSSLSYYKQDKLNFTSRSQVRVSLIDKNLQTHTTANITIDSWPSEFNLFLAFIKRPLGNNYYLIIGKDWSIIEEHTLSADAFKPYPAGFEGSKRYPQIQIYKIDKWSNLLLIYKFALENRSYNNGVVVGKNENREKETVSNSNVYITRKTIPAVSFNFSCLFPLPYGRGRFYSFAETQPVYLFYDGGEHEKYPYVIGGGIMIGLKAVSLYSEFIHSEGLVGVSGIKGNGLKTYSYIYVNNKLIKRDSNAFNLEAGVHISKRLFIAGGLDLVDFYNSNYANSLFLNKEVKRVGTIFTLIDYKTTKCTSLFLEWQSIKTKYFLSNRFDTAVGSELWFGYRYWF